MAIIDSQVHAYEANTRNRPWHSVPNWPAHVTGDEMVAAMDKVGVDGAIFTAAERHWQSMCSLLGRPDLATSPDYASTVARAKNMAEIDDIVGAWTAARAKDEVLRLLNEAHVPCAPVKTAREVAYDPHLEARGFWVDIDHPRRGPTRVPISPIRLHTGGKSEIRSPAPTLGQHTEAVLAELLGLKAEELATLRAQRVTEPVRATPSDAASGTRARG